MASTKVTTVIVNRTGEALDLKVGNQNCFAKLATVEVGGEHKVEIDVNWTYREYSLQPVKAGLLKRVVVSSDDCCDFERITVSESGGKFHVEEIVRGQFNTSVPVINNWMAIFWSKIKRGIWR